MHLTPVSFGTARAIEGYGPGFFRVGGQLMRSALIVTPWSALPWGGADDLETPLGMAGQVDLLLFGCGVAITPVPTAFRQAMESHGIAVEPMSTPAACRTYNLLLGEGRRVMVALLPVTG
jgi:uncharacterized protein